MASTLPQPAKTGDAVEVVGHRVGEAVRHGSIVEVLGAPDGIHYRIAWEDGHESILYPSADVRVIPARKSSKTAKR